MPEPKGSCSTSDSENQCAMCCKNVKIHLVCICGHIVCLRCSHNALAQYYPNCSVCGKPIPDRKDQLGQIFLKIEMEIKKDLAKIDEVLKTIQAEKLNLEILRKHFLNQLSANAKVLRHEFLMNN